MATNVMVVDDDKDYCFSFVESLILMGYSAMCAQSILEARDKVQKNLPDIIIMDLFPRGQETGMSFLLPLRQAHPEIIMCVVTAWCGPCFQQQRKLAAENNIRWVEKPFNFSELEGILSGLL